MKTKSKKHISLVLSTFILGSMGLVGCSRDSSGSAAPEVTPEKPVITKTVSGIAVDGYIKLATVTLHGVNTQTNDIGIWSMAYTGDNSDVVSIKGGFDTSTGKPFEGTLKAELGEDGANVAVTPLSTLVSSLVQHGATKAAASTKIATQLGISEATLAGDPIAILATGTTEQKSEAASAMKSILTVQKAAEAFAKSMGEAGSDNYEATITGMYDVIATQLSNATASTTAVSSFDAVMANTSGLTTALQTTLAATVTDSLLNDRLQAASSSVASVISSIHSISNADIANHRDSVAKAVEQLTTLTENKLVLISTATTIAAIGTAQTNAAVVAEQNDITNLVNDYNVNPDLGVTDSVVTPTEPVVTPPVVTPTEPVVTPPVVTPTEPVVTPPSSGGGGSYTPPTTESISVTTANTSAYNAGSLGVTFNFTAGTYTYAIANFNDGDVLNFPDGNNPTIINTDFTDGNLTVQWAYDGNVIMVNLSNIPTADDAYIYGTTSFRTAFGASSIQ